MTEVIEAPAEPALNEDDICHMCCCRRFGKVAICGTDLTDQTMVLGDPEITCPMCAHIIGEYADGVMKDPDTLITCPIDGRLCAEEES